jgi:hypothetical protein
MIAIQASGCAPGTTKLPERVSAGGIITPQ